MSKSERIPQQRIYHIIDTTLGKEFLVKARSREHAVRILTEPRYFVQTAQPVLIAERMSSGVRLITEDTEGPQTTFDFEYTDERDPETNTDRAEEPIAALNGSAQQ
mgnify:CR=1 FL=1